MSTEEFIMAVRLLCVYDESPSEEEFDDAVKAILDSHTQTQVWHLRSCFSTIWEHLPVMDKP